MHIEHSVSVSASPWVVWSVMSDVAAWPSWTPAIQNVQVRDLDTFGPGSKARVLPRGANPSTWKITSWQPGRGFTWETRQQGLHFVAHHRIAPADGGSTLTIAVDVNGIPARFLRPFIEGPTRRNVVDEAEGLKAESERVSRRRQVA